MSLFSEEEQAAPRRTLLRSTRVRRTAACIALPIGLYAALAGVGLLPLPWSEATNAVAPVAGPPSAVASDLPYPSIQGDPRPEVSPTPAYSTEPPGVRHQDVQPDGRSGDSSGRPTPGAPTTGTAEDRNRRVLPTITARPPVLPTPTSTPSPTVPPPPTVPPTTTPSSPRPTSTPSPTPPVTDPDDPTLVDRLFGWLDALTP
ncbi:hypothetical protein ACQPXM_38210 [Kribbella sp. CA-253562]|uniref:hypothetical protein n=1 Tax=Kribbella sp. CA-253562 TaxID=3239942 RepID=UPI003D92553D